MKLSLITPRLAALAAVVLFSCTPGARWSAAELLLRKAQCALAHKDLSNEQIFVECAIDPKDAANVMDIVGQERASQARASMQTEIRTLAAMPSCGDVGAR